MKDKYTVQLSSSYKKKATKFLKRNPQVLASYKKTLQMLELNPHHPSLRLHRLHGKLKEFHSVSINMQYRIVIDFMIKDDLIILINIGTHNQSY